MLSLSMSHFLSLFRLYNFHLKPVVPTLSVVSSIIHSHAYSHISSSNPITDLKNPILFNYLIDSFGFRKPMAVSISDRFSHINTIEKPQSVVKFLKKFGFLDNHIGSFVRVCPQILFCNIETTLKPKLCFFQELGLWDSQLGEFISKNSTLLTHSLDKRLKPCIQILRKFLVNDVDNKNLIRVLRRCNWVVQCQSRLLSNIAYLQSCGIVGSQLTLLLVRRPRLFTIDGAVIRELVSRSLESGFLTDSKMFVYSLYTLSCMSRETFSKKFELLRSFGFSDAECLEMFRRMPVLFRTSEKKLKLGMKFFLNTVEFQRSVLICNPVCLMYSMKERVIPRYRVLHIIKLKRLLKKEPNFRFVLTLSEEKFLDKYISKFIKDAEELLVAYKGDILASPE